MSDNIYQEHKEEINQYFFGYFPQLKEILEQEGEEMLMNRLHIVIDKFMAHPDIVKDISCGAGCSFCCHDRIMATSIEGRHIKRYMEKHKIKFNESLAKKQSRRGYDNISWKDKRCSLLSEGGRCQIYPVRPMICRTHNSTSPIELCDRGTNPKSVTRDAKIPDVEGIFMALVHLDGKGQDMDDLATFLTKHI